MKTRLLPCRCVARACRIQWPSSRMLLMPVHDTAKEEISSQKSKILEFQCLDQGWGVVLVEKSKTSSLFVGVLRLLARLVSCSNWIKVKIQENRLPPIVEVPQKLVLEVPAPSLDLLKLLKDHAYKKYWYTASFIYHSIFEVQYTLNSEGGRE